jgi:hypothetical protein
MDLYSGIKKSVKFLLKPVEYSLRKSMPKTYHRLCQLKLHYTLERMFRAKMIAENRFVDYQKNQPILPLVKLIAFYTPQSSWEDVLKPKSAPSFWW